MLRAMLGLILSEICDYLLGAGCFSNQRDVEASLSSTG
jgi:hypothetical protein